MEILILLISIAFALLLPRGTNIPYLARPRVTQFLLLTNLAVHFLTQVIDLQSGMPLTKLQSMVTGEYANSPIMQYMDTFALTPSKLRSEGGWRWMQILTANFIHADWFHLIGNLWFFFLFGINLEDLFGRKRFIVFVVSALVCSQLGVAFLSEGTKAFEMPHAGFSGVVYAALAAYLVCFPRSKINVVLIYDVFFWVIVAFGISTVTIVVALFLGTLSEVVWLLLFIGFFAMRQPEYASFGIPAFIFLGYRVIQDGLTLDVQAEQLSISIWSHAGGFLTGLAAGIAVNGFKGLSQTWEELREQTFRADKRTGKSEAAGASDPAATSDAIRGMLGRMVFLGDGEGACDLYVRTVMPRHHDMVLEPMQQLALARMLEMRNQPKAALQAFDNLFWKHPDIQGIERGYLAAAKLCAAFPSRILDGLRYVNKFETLALFNRDKIEARLVRDGLLAAARKEGIDPGGAVTEVFVGNLAAKEGGSDDRRDRVSSPAKSPAVQGRAARMHHLEPAIQPEAFPVGGKRLSGIQPIEASDGRQLASGAPALASAPGPESAGDATDKVAAQANVPKTVPKETRGGQELETQRPEKIPDPNSGDQDRVSRTPFLKREEPEKRRSLTESAGGLFDSPRIAGSAEERRFYGDPVPQAETAKSSAAGSDDKARKYAILLVGHAGVNIADLAAALVTRFGSEEAARKAVAEGKGMLLRELDSGEAREWVARFAAAGIQVRAMSESRPALSVEPVEIRSAEVSGSEILLRIAAGCVRAPLRDVRVLSLAMMKLSRRSVSYKPCMEVVLKESMYRYQAWERTLDANACTVDGVPGTQGEAIQTIFAALSSRVPGQALSLAASHAVSLPGEWVKFDTYQEYENFMAYTILSQTGESLE